MLSGFLLIEICSWFIDGERIIKYWEIINGKNLDLVVSFIYVNYVRV